MDKFLVYAYIRQGDVAIVSSEIKYNLPKTSGSSNHSPDKDTRKYFTNVFVRSYVSDRFQLLTQLSSSQETIHPHHSVYRVCVAKISI